MSRKAPKVLFIYPPNQLMGIEIPRPDGSLGLLYLAGALRAIGIEVEILDASVGTEEDALEDTFHRRELQPNGLVRIGMSSERLRKYLAKGRYDIVGIHSNFTPQTKMALEVASLAKEVYPEALVIVGGVNARALAERFFASASVDLIATSEADRSIVQIVRAWQNGNDFSNLDGVMFISGGKMVSKPARPESTYTLSLDQVPFPAWDLLPFGKYDALNAPHGSILSTGQTRRYAPLMTSRGCPFACAYCHISTELEGSLAGPLGNLRLKSVDRVMREVEVLRGLGVTHLYLEDDSLLAKKARVIELFRRLMDLGLKISNVNGVNLVHFATGDRSRRLRPDKEYLEIMAAAGFTEIVFPVESGSQRVLNKYASGKLRYDRLDVTELVRTAVQTGITCPVNMMIGFPDETEAEMRQSIQLGERLIQAGAPYVTFFIPIPFPGSQLFDYAIRHGHLRPDFDPDRMNWKTAVMEGTTVPPERVVALRDEAWHRVNTDDYKRKRLEREIGSRIALTTE